jgi:glycosyltransferase involved in cell wall biosynthesis
MGTGEHGRQLVSALRTQGIPVALTTLRPDGSPEDEAFVARSDMPAVKDPFAGVSLLCVNADMVPQVTRQLGRRFFAGRYTIGFWAWEVSSFPSRFASAFDHLDEVWVGSRHVHDAVSQVATRPVAAIPQPVWLASSAARSAPPPDLPVGFRFLFAFDYLSVFERKNPLGAIEAFTMSFAPGSGAKLIVKALNPDHDPPAHRRLVAAAAQHPDISLIERRLSRDERDGLMRAADCYVSLHRAEGFGYTLAESMWLGKPVIATAYSGNVDYMTPENSYLVDYRLVPIGLEHAPYPADGEWAQPDVAQAARLMRDVFENRDAAAARGERAGIDIRRTHSPEAAGRAMRARLEHLVASSSWSARTRGSLARIASRIPIPMPGSRAGEE